MESVLDITVSCFANFRTADDCKPVNLLHWLRSAKYASQVDKIRSINDKSERDAIKSTLPAITPSGLFTYRNNAALTRHSGLVCLDIDYKGNERIANYLELKREFSKINNVAYAGLSVSGTGFFLLIPIAFPEQHISQFNALRNLFQERYDVRVDSTPDVSRLRGYSFDPNAYFNHQATPFSVIETLPLSKPITTAYSRSTINTNADLLQSLSARVAAANEGERHNVLLRESRLAGGLIAAGRIDEVSTIIILESITDSWPNTAKSSRTIRDGIIYGKESPVYTSSFVGFGSTSHKRLAEENPVYTRTIAEQLANPGSTLRPDVSLVTRIPIIDCRSYPAEWDEPTPSDIIPTVKQIPIQRWLTTHKASF